MSKLENESIDLVLTSPPYANQRKNQYSSISEEEYPSFTVSWMSECKRILKKTGSVLIIIRTNLRDGHISPYVMKTRLELWQSGWIEPEELIWIKPDAAPLGSIKRPRRSWEQILWFALNPSVYVDLKKVESKRCGYIGKKGIGEYRSGISTPVEGKARIRDYFSVGVSSNARTEHPAPYPEELASRLISWLCPVGGVVLDPFIGSGTTALAAIESGMRYIGFDNKKEYCDLSTKRIIQRKEVNCK